MSKKPLCCGDNRHTDVEITRQDGSTETLHIPETVGGGVGVRGCGPIYVRRTSNDPEVWEGRQLMAIMGSCSTVAGGLGEREVEDPWREDCTCNYVSGVGRTKEAAVIDMLNQLKRNLDSFHA